MDSILSDDIIKKLSDAGCEFDENTVLSDLCSFKIGGKPNCFVKIPSDRALGAFMELVPGSGEPYIFIGGGTNVLFPDIAARRAIAKLTGEFEEFFVKENFVSCGAGVKLPLLVNKTASEALSGLECCAGIPGTVGGAVFGNAGSADSWIGDVVESVEVYKKNQSNVFEKCILKSGEIPFGYRESGLEGCVISRVNFSLKKSDGNDILKTVKESIEKRVNSQPLSLPNAGCIFKNPMGLSAGKLIDDAGLKGRKKGGAQVSETHGNFIVNTGGATYDDILDLIYIVRRTVKEKFNIDMELELKIFDF